MAAELLPDDVADAERIVRLTNANRRLAAERDYWRARANRHDPDYQDAKGDAELAERQEREHEEDCNGR
jgi:hypothetical protein